MSPMGVSKRWRRDRSSFIWMALSYYAQAIVNADIPPAPVIIASVGGIVLGDLQWHVLEKCVPWLGRWAAATAAGYFFGSLAVMLIDTFANGVLDKSGIADMLQLING